MSSVRRLLLLVVCLVSPLPLAADELPSRAVARFGDYCLYPGDEIRCVAISHDGRRVATGVGKTLNLRSAERPRTIIVWDATTGKETRRWKLPDGELSCLAFSPDGKQLVVGCAGALDEPHYVYVYDPETSKLVRRLGSFKNSVNWLEYSTDGKRLHVGEDVRLSPGAMAITAWDAATGERRGRWDALTIPPRETDTDYTTWNILEGRLSADEKIILWHMDIQTETPRGATDFAKHRPILRGYDAATNKELYEVEADFWSRFLFSADGKRFLLRSEPPTLREAATGKVVCDLKESKTSREVAALFPDGRRAVLFGDSYSSLRVYDVDSGKFPHAEKTIEPHAEASDSTVSGDGKTLLLVAHGTVRLWDLDTGKERQRQPGHRLPLERLWFSPDGKTLVSQCDEAICEWNVAQGVEVSYHPQFAPAKGETLLARSLDGRFVVIQDTEALRLRETKTGKAVRTFAADEHKKHGAVFSPLGDKLALWFDSKEPGLEWFDVTTGKRLGKIANADLGGAAFFSPDGRLLAWPTHDQSIAVVETTSQQLLPPLPIPSQRSPLSRSYNLLAFSADNDYLVAAAWVWGNPLEPAPIRVFHMRSGQEIGNFFLHPEDEGKSDLLSALAFSPDGRLLAVIEHGSKAIRVLEIASGRTRLILSGHRATLTTLAFSPNGNTLASGGRDNVIYLWDITGTSIKGLERGTAEELDAWWHDLSGADGVRAGEASAALIRNAERSVPFLKERLRPVQAVDEKRLARLLADLDADAFEQREAASGELARLGEEVDTALRRALKNKPAPEAKRRIEELLEKLDRHALSPETLRSIRAVEALEHVGTPAARELLKELAQGAPEARQTREAKGSVRRLEGW